MIFIDSDILIDITRGKPNAIAWLNAMHPIGVVISGYSAMELIDGTQNREDMRKTQLVLHKIRAIWPSSKSCSSALKTFEQIHLANGIGFIDVLIAHTALEFALPLHTFNVRHFTAVPDLQTIQPYTR